LNRRRVKKIIAKYKGDKKYVGARKQEGKQEKRQAEERGRGLAAKSAVRQGKEPAVKRERIRERRRERIRERRRWGRKLLFMGALAGGGALVARAYLEEPGPGTGTVTMRDENPGPLATMLGKLLEDLLKDPQKKALADNLQLSVAIQDIDHPELAATMSFLGSDVTVSNGVAAGSDVFIGSGLSLLLSLSGAGKGLQVVRWLRSPDGQKVVEALKGGRLKIRGLAGKPVQMILFQRFLTPSG